MKIIHYIPSINRESGGTSSYMQLLASELGKKVELHVVTHQSANELPLGNCQLHYIDHWSHFLRMKKQWNRLVNEIVPDIVHVNCCWQPGSALVQRWSYRRGIKTVYSPHGMLEPRIVERHYWTRKLPALLLYQKAAIKRSVVILATAKSECQNLVKLGYNRDVVVVPNGIDVSQIRLKNSWKKMNTILFLSRIHVTKGLDLLIDSVAELRNDMKDYKVLIVGEGDSEYVTKLKELSKKQKVDDIILFVGGLYGEAKWDLFHQADIFILPTHSENFGIVIAEALASGTPVITTEGAPWEELLTAHCGWWVPCTQKDIANAIRSAINSTDEELQILGKNGRRLVEERYSVESIALKMKTLYEWLLVGGSKPIFVY